MRVGVYGYGVVGGALGRYLELGGHTVLKKDPGLGLNDPMSPRPDCLFICVPVPTKAFRQQLDHVEGILEQWRGSDIPIFLRSTVLPGTADRLSARYNCNVISCPEFLTERQADKDMADLPILVGRRGLQVMEQLFEFRRIIQLENSECEMAKYVHNCFGAYKVTFFNAMFRLCRRTGLNYGNVLEGVLASGHINPPHTQVPGPDGQTGYGGKCFPKDMEAMVGMMEGDPFGKLLLDVYCLNRLYRGIKGSPEFKGLDL